MELSTSNGGWVLRLKDAVLTIVQIDYRLTLRIVDEGEHGQIVIETARNMHQLAE